MHAKDLENDRIQRDLELERLDLGDVHHTLGYHLNIDSENSATQKKSIVQTCIRYTVVTTYSPLHYSSPCFI